MDFGSAIAGGSRDQLFTDESLPIRGNLDRGVVGSLKLVQAPHLLVFQGSSRTIFSLASTLLSNIISLGFTLLVQAMAD